MLGTECLGPMASLTTKWHYAPQEKHDTQMTCCAQVPRTTRAQELLLSAKIRGPPLASPLRKQSLAATTSSQRGLRLASTLGTEVDHSPESASVRGGNKSLGDEGFDRSASSEE